MPVTIRPTYSWALVVELVRIACTARSEHVKSLELDGRLTVPIIMVIAPAIIILFLPMRSPNINTKRLPTAQPISWTPRTLTYDCHVKTIQLTYIATYNAKRLIELRAILWYQIEKFTIVPCVVGFGFPKSRPN